MKRALLALAVTSLLALTPPAMAMAERSELGELQLTEVVGGLEHPWALAFLPEGQGYLISEPLPANQAETFMRSFSSSEKNG